MSVSSPRKSGERPVCPQVSKLRRAQALAFGTELGLKIARHLIELKLSGQERVVRDILRDTNAADEIARFRAALSKAKDLNAVRNIESQAAADYWATFRDVQVMFPTKDVSRVPQHWRTFGTRKSVLTGSPRLATNAANAMWNYCYALLESECRLAAAALGLDPGLGVLHVDTPARDSLACDLMESVRPQVDRYLLAWILSQPLRREWFFERRDGNCRLMASLTVRLSETTSTWGRAVAPIAEWLAQELWTSTRKKTPKTDMLPTRLTQRRRSEGRGKQFALVCKPAPDAEKVCRRCGAPALHGENCSKCGRELASKKMIQLAKVGRGAAQSPASRQKRSNTQRLHKAAQRAWRLGPKTNWITEETYKQKIQPRLASVSLSTVASTLGVSVPYAADIRTGRRRPHPRHWLALTKLVGILDSADLNVTYFRKESVEPSQRALKLQESRKWNSGEEYCTPDPNANVSTDCLMVMYDDVQISRD